MEVEAKFTLPDLETLQRLQAIDHLAGLALSAGQARQVHDTYLDTTGRPILAAGYACRKRECDGKILITLKGLGGAQGAIHRREELEVALLEVQPPADWPDSATRERVLELIGDQPLVPLFDLRQTRIVRVVSQDERPVAELSLDDVHVVVGDKEQAYFELEVELTPQGTKDHLAAMATCLQDEWGLQPETRSKFERALALVQENVSGVSLLTPDERTVCERLAKRDDLYGRRARAVLALDGSASQAEAGKRAGLSARRVRYWLAAFRHKRLDIFPSQLLTQSEAQVTSLKSPPTPLLTHPGLDADDSMAEAARKTLYFHFLRMLAHEPGTRLGEDIEELHDMRVATRRMRAALRVFDDYLDPKAIKPFAKMLRRVGRALGAVRDLDVFRYKTQLYLDKLPPERQGELEPLLVVWKAERDKAREQMLAELDSDRYARFKEQFGAFLQTPGAGALPVLTQQGEPLPHRVRHVAPVALYQHLAEVRAFDEWITRPDAPLVRFHQLRIAFKGLRYTLEFFQEVLGAEAKALINEIKTLQDHLGDLQDAVVTCNVLRGFLMWGTWGHTTTDQQAHSVEPVVAPGVASYLAARQAEIQHLMETFPQAWARVQSPEFSREVTAIVIAL